MYGNSNFLIFSSVYIFQFIDQYIMLQKFVAEINANLKGHQNQQIEVASHEEPSIARRTESSVVNDVRICYSQHFRAPNQESHGEAEFSYPSQRNASISDHNRMIYDENDLLSEKKSYFIEPIAQDKPGCSINSSCNNHKNCSEEEFINVLDLLVEKCDEKEPNNIRICADTNCSNRIQFNRGYCKDFHGGKQLCSKNGCSNKPQGKSFCISHGGGKRCKVHGCMTAAQSNNACKKHGGGTRCKIEGCTKSSQGKKLCRTHGGGKRCMEVGCTLGSQSGRLCAKHGGVKTCKEIGCAKKDRGGGYCNNHRVGKLCCAEGCKKFVDDLRNRLCKRHIRELEIRSHKLE